ncbi:MAG: cytochrome C [Planctomycetota bacterium]
MLTVLPRELERSFVMEGLGVRIWLSCLMLLGSLLVSTAGAQDLKWVTSKPLPDWTWDAAGSKNGQKIYLRKNFAITQPIKSAKVYATCDNKMTLWINGEEVGKARDWMYPLVTDVSKQLASSQNTIAVEARNEGGIAAFVLKLVIDHGDSKTIVLSDSTWKMSPRAAKNWTAQDFDDSSWRGKLKSSGKLGVSPWGVLAVRRGGSGGQIAATDEMEVAEGFVVDHLYTVPREKQGSWVSLTVGPDGRLIACDQGDKGAFFIAVGDSKTKPTVRVEPIDVNSPGSSNRLSGAQGLLWAFDALWFHRNGGHLYRITDTDSDGKLDTAQQLPSQRGGGEHGNHALILTEDGTGIYMDGGNHAPLAETSRSRVQSWEEDLLLPRMWDANGHARGKLAPGGWVTRLDPETMQQELVCIGFRNQYDIALNRHGDLFTYDADMEWDMGSPWYRPTRVCQVVSGGDFGWRSGTGKWPTYYEDSLPPVVDIGPGSPTGVAAGLGAAFPAKYQDAIFALDWTFGTIYAIHMQPEGAGYKGTSEPFVTGSPLPVTDAVVGKDGALYFTVGGRGTQSALYRVRYVGSASTAPASEALPKAVAEARRQRKSLEAYHGKSLSGDAAKQAIDAAWPFLASGDRFLRHAARVAIESQPVELWATRAMKEAEPQARITAAVALARSGGSEHKSELLKSLLQLDSASLTESQLLGLLRAYALTTIRLGEPDEMEREALIDELDPLLPHASEDVNTELVRVLVSLRAPNVIEKTMALIRGRNAPSLPDWSELASRNARYGGTVQKILDNPPPRELSYALMLRTLRDGWTLAQRREYFEFLNVTAKCAGGASYPGFMRNIRDEALSWCSDDERVALQDITGERYDPVPDFEIKPIQGPGRTWTLETARSQAANRFKQADFENGRSLYFAASCGKCHRFSGLGGNIGPDLTTIPRKFDVGYLIEHIIEPSKVISDQYQSSSVLTSDGRSYVGLMSEADGKVVIYPADVKAEPISLDADDVELVQPSKVSQMPKGLIDGMNAEEVRDLLAYLMSGGDRNDRKVYGR